MNLQPASRKEIRRVGAGVLVCDDILIAALFLLSLVDVGTLSPLRSLLGAALGSGVAVANFAVLCVTVQTAAQTDDPKAMKRKFQLSYNIRLFLQALWVLAAYLIPWIHFVAGAAPILFPNVVIFYLQARGKLVAPGNPSAAGDAELEERPGPFEV